MYSIGLLYNGDVVREQLITFNSTVTTQQINVTTVPGAKIGENEEDQVLLATDDPNVVISPSVATFNFTNSNGKAGIVVLCQL